MIERELANKDKHVAKKQKMITPRIKCESNISRVIKQIADFGTIDTTTVWENPDAARGT